MYVALKSAVGFVILEIQAAPVIHAHCDDEKEKHILHLLELQQDSSYKGARIAVDGQFSSMGHSATVCAVGVYDLDQGLSDLHI